MPASEHPYTTTDTRRGVVHVLPFRDRRGFHEIRVALERKLMLLFKPALHNGTLRAHAEGKVNGAHYRFELSLDTAALLTNAYTLRAEGSWSDFEARHDDYFRQSSHSWFRFWTTDLTPSQAPSEGDRSGARYRRLCDAALSAEAHLDSVEAIQRAIIEGLKRGARYSSAHKEGGSIIGWKAGGFYRSDYGDDPGDATWKDDASFLAMLEQFCYWDVRQPNGDAISDVDRWHLIWRRMHDG